VADAVYEAMNKFGVKIIVLQDFLGLLGKHWFSFCTSKGGGLIKYLITVRLSKPALAAEDGDEG
jgi:hypothetical protein